jgi:hypothetical protein
MRKLSAPVVLLSVLLSLAWLGYQVSNPVAAQQGQPATVETRPTVRWEYRSSVREEDLNALGPAGWEAYAVIHSGSPLYYLKRPMR